MCAWLLTAAPVVDASPMANLPDRPVVTMAQQANEALSLTASTIIQLDVTDVPGQAISIEVPIDGVDQRIDLEPYSIRAVGSFVRVYGANGEFVDQEPGPVRTMRGEVVDIDGAVVAASLKNDGLHAMALLPDGREIWVEPLVGKIPGATAQDYVLYHGEDVIPSNGTCGTINDKHAIDAQVDGLGGGEDDGGIAGDGLFFCAEVGLDADVEYYNAHGQNVAAVTADMEAVINAVNVQYETQVDIAHVITGVIVRTQEPDPYSTTDAGGLLNQFAGEWNANQGAIPRDVAHLFTGKNLNGGTIGIAALGVICITGSAYGLVQSDCCGSFACSTDLSAHELGHNWAALHCSCPSNTMNPSITCTNVFTSGTVNTIINFRNSRPCLTQCIGNEDGMTSLPFFDDFPEENLDSSLWTGITGVTADFTGNGEPSPPRSARISGGEEIRSAILDLSAASNVTFSYWWQRTGGGNSPETGEDLLVEYRLADGTWAQLSSHPGAGSDNDPYIFESFSAPADALHDGFRLRFRNPNGEAGVDDWFVDNVGIDGIVAPDNDICSDINPLILVLPAAEPFTTLGASTDGPTQTGDVCEALENDVWFRFGNTCDQVIRFEICDADYDVQLAIYGSECPTDPLELIACSNDDECGTGSVIELSLVTGLYKVRIGGTNGVTGSGTIAVSCVEGNPCPGDFDGSGGVDTVDLLALLAAWGTNGAGADLADPTDIVDVADLLALLAAWGDCP